MEEHLADKQAGFVKFVDDTYLILGAAMCHTITDEIEGVHHWATKNN